MHNKPHTEEAKLKISLSKKKAGVIPPNVFKKGYTPWNKGKPSPWVSERNRLNNPGKSNKEHHNWQGEFASYRSMHRWVVRHKGQPKTCTHCNKTGLTSHRIHWANIDHKYRRNLDDYIRLCVKCHHKYDSQLE
jgi:hypothetical protein